MHAYLNVALLAFEEIATCATLGLFFNFVDSEISPIISLVYQPGLGWNIYGRLSPCLSGTDICSHLPRQSYKAVIFRTFTRCAVRVQMTEGANLTIIMGTKYPR